MADSQTTQTKLQNVRGLNIHLESWFPAKNIEDAMDYLPHDNDIILCSYPKTGTHLVQYTILQIISKGELFPSLGQSQFQLFPFMEMAGKDVVEAMQPPRMYKHHLPYNLVQKNSKSKVLYVYRQPEDTFVSYFHFQKDLVFHEIDFDKYFNGFLSGQIGYGSYFDHVLSFMAHKKDENLLLISFEKLISDKRNQILRIAKFLGDEYYQQLMADEEILKKVEKNTSFEHMKNNLDVSSEGGQTLYKKLSFFRKGIVGDGKNRLSSSERQLLKEKAESIMKGCEVLEEWYKEM